MKLSSFKMNIFSWTSCIQVSQKNVYKSYNKNMLINPIYECGVKATLVINPICGGMNLPCPDDSNKTLTLVCKSQNKNMFINPSYECGVKITPVINPTCGG